MTDKIWERQEAEPINWFKRFEIYRLMPNRSLRGAYLEFKKTEIGRKGQISNANPPTSAPSSWREAFKIYDWEYRAMVSDEFDIEEARRKKIEDEEQEREERKKKRRELLNGLEGAVDKAFKSLDFDKSSPFYYKEFLQLYLTETRLEYGDTPAQQLEISGKQGKPIEVAVQNDATVDKTAAKIIEILHKAEARRAARGEEAIGLVPD